MEGLATRLAGGPRQGTGGSGRRSVWGRLHGAGVLRAGAGAAAHSSAALELDKAHLDGDPAVGAATAAFPRWCGRSVSARVCLGPW